MAELRTEEEQVQAIKDWWKKNGSSLLIGIGAALAIVFGWQAWQNHQAQERAEAANQFTTLLTAFSTGDEDSNNTVEFVAESLREEHDSSAYAIYGNLVLARQQMMVENNPEAAVESLQWALEKATDYKALSLVIRHRLAQAQFAAGQHDGALETLDGASDAKTFSAVFSELRGDILLAKGDMEGAREAYLTAREQGPSRGGDLLELKLSDLGVGEGA
ncbi:tetratricopeptide repeat protein [Marinobacter sp. MDS2]|uniref:YfgM family protein n=1 Tax=Marinobacter sp. MDS2 TaxID=3065961 RepID=UPI00273B8FAD|nr:tetratricopeptide repeat protein [Marinobacter sp. MDS2]MDP4548923.1 tetratricopeptide repeat protein [Marinobacter sp. MDS2]